MTTPPIGTGGVDLPHWGVIRAQGADAAAFLHGQLTQDVLGLDGASLRLAGLCSVKGRLLGSFLLWREASDSLLLAASSDLVPALLKRLSMFVLRAKCRLSDASDSLQLTGFVGEQSMASLGLPKGSPPWARVDVPAGTLLTLPEVDAHPRAILVHPRSAESVSTAAWPTLPLVDWQWLEVRSALPLISAATSEQFVPQMVNFETVGGVNFKKGCFPGQEVVARSQYRGTTKRRSFLFACNEAAQAGQEVYAASDATQPAGMVVNAASRTPNEHCALVEVKLAALESSLHLGSVDGPLLSALPMPYALLPQDTEQSP